MGVHLHILLLPIEAKKGNLSEELWKTRRYSVMYIQYTYVVYLI